MRWRDLRRSSNVEDRRGRGGGLRPVAMGGVGGMGAIVVVVIALLLGVDPSALLDLAPVEDRSQVGRPVGQGGDGDQQAQFVAAVLADTEDSWNAIFTASGGRYREPTLVLFEGSVNSACGFASAAVGPFYCPGDHKVYLDLSFLDQLSSRFGAPGDFAQAYVIAHEVGHHVQALLGVMAEVDRLRRRASPAEANALSVRVELQADCFAGVWAHYADRERRLLEPGDLEEALQAAAAVGDDTLQRRSQGYVVPESFTHGTAEQRATWFRRGYESGDPQRCDTFSGDP